MAIRGSILSKHCKTSDLGKGSSEHPFLEVLLMIPLTSSIVSSLKWWSGVLSITSSSGLAILLLLSCGQFPILPWQ